MKCALVLLAAALFLCSLHTGAARAKYIQKGSVPNLNMRSNKLQETLTAADKSFIVSVDVQGTDAAAGTVTVKIVSTGALTFTGTGTGSLTSGGTSPIKLTFPSSDSGGKTVTGQLTVTGTLSGTDTFSGTGTSTSTGTLTGSTPVTVTISGSGDKTVTGTVTVTPGGSSNANTITVSGTVAIAKTQGGTGGSGGSSGGHNSENVPVVTTTTTTEAPETTTTSTAAPTEAPPQQSTEKPTNPTEGKTDSSNSHVAWHFALFIGTIALLSVFL